MEQEIISQILQHIQVLNDDYTKMSVDVAVLKAQMETIVWWFRIIGAGFVGLMITQFWQIVILRKNGKK